MAGRIREILSEVGRREFFGKLLVGSSAVATGVFGLSYDAAAHDERLTMLGAVLGRAFGITTYRIRHSASLEESHVVAELLTNAGQSLGEFVRTRQFRISLVEDYVKGEEIQRKKPYQRREETQLDWSGETLEIRTEHAAGTMRLKYNGHWLGSATFSQGGSPTSDLPVKAFLENRGQLVAVLDGISRDIDQLLPPPPRVSEGCCCNFGSCEDYLEHYCSGYGATRYNACASATDCMNLDCWNSYCTGCCSSTGCQCSCVSGDFLCGCVNNGFSCGCRNQCV